MSTGRGRPVGQRNATVLVSPLSSLTPSIHIILSDIKVTDSRDRQSQPQQRRRRSPGTRFITVDNVLQYASDIPSMQQRNPAPQRPRPRSRVASATGRLIGGGSSGAGGGAGSATASGTIGRLAAQPRLPPRTTKMSEKLVLLPEADEITEEDEAQAIDDEEEPVDEELVERLAKEKDVDPERIRYQLLAQQRLGGDFGIDNDQAPLLAEEELLRRRKVAPERAKSYAERLPKARRHEKLARVTAYCTAQAYKMTSLATFVKELHGARTKLYDDCLYTAYHLPLLQGPEGYRLKSSPVIKYPGGKSLLDEEIERNELRDHHEDYAVEAEEHSVGRRQEHEHEHGSPQHESEGTNQHGDLLQTIPEDEQMGQMQAHTQEHHPSLPTQTQAIQPQSPASRLPYDVAEMLVFSYGVVVFWNFTEKQEKDLLADLAFATSSATGTPIPLATAPLDEEDFETEEFHFEYSTAISRPRVYNDMITLRSGNHMIKLAISHGIAQSTKLCLFEEVMARQMAEAKDVPRRLAITGNLGMKREEVFRILGRLFKSRVEVNLCMFLSPLFVLLILLWNVLIYDGIASNMLDVPNFFWESEPTLYPLYIAVREYLEIKPRIQVLNERCRVFLDLAEILSDSIADNKTSRAFSPISPITCIN